MRAIVINCSKGYNLGARKLADWLHGQGHSVTFWNGDPGFFAFGYELVALSVIFSWDAPLARDIALRVKSNAEVWCGGPGMTGLVGWWKQQTGLTCVRGLDWRFERQRGNYRMTFASRGCPVGCWFCVVPTVEGTTFTLDHDFQPAPTLCDNNLSALPFEFQQHIVNRYIESGVKLTDANSGFEPRTFTEDVYHLWKGVLRGPWRFAFDEMSEAAEVKRMMDILKAEPAGKKQVYVLIGNEPVVSCHERARKVIEWGGEPFCQMLRPLNHLGGPLKTRHDWTEQLGQDFCRYFNRHLWRSLAIVEYRPRKYSPLPFAAVAL